MRPPKQKSVFALVSAAACCLTWFSGIARGNINIELRAAVNAAAPNDIVNIGLYLVSDHPSLTQYSAAADVVFGWNNTRLQFLGIENPPNTPTNPNPHPVLSSYLPADFNLNEVVPPQDGTGYYQMLGQLGNPLAATPAGSLLTTFRFRALSTICTGAHFTILPSGGSPQKNTRVLDGFTPGLPVTGTLGSSLVFIDAVAPIINTCAPAQNVPADASCQGTMPDLTGLLTVTDNCPNLTITQTPLAGTLLALGPHAVVIQVKDPGNNIANCNTSVTVADQTAPQITTCPGDQTIAADLTCQAAIPNLTGLVVASDNCTLTPGLVIWQSLNAGTPVGVGPHTVTISVQDAALNTATCDVTITVADQTDPQITTCPDDQTIAENGTCQAAIPDLTLAVVASDNCTAANNLSISQVPTAGTLVGLGSHNVTITVEDADGNTDDCVVVINITDQTDPQITTCPSDQTIAADASCQAAIPSLTGSVVASDNCTAANNLNISQAPTAGTLVGLGSHNVTITVEDADGNTDDCVVAINITDQTGPQITTCPGDQTIAADLTCQAAIPNLAGSVVANDNCTLTPSLVISQSPTAGTMVGIGTHPVTISVKDAANNEATCPVVITVADQTDPVISQCAASQTIAADTSCQAIIPNLIPQVVADDACSPPVVITQSPAAGTLVGLGAQPVTLTATDGAGNDVSCIATITVADQSAPQITTCPSDQTIAADASCQAAIPNLTGSVVASDNCTPALSLVITQSPAAGTMVGLGAHPVTISVKDAANNEATCPVIITVTDQTDPVINQCAASQTIPANANCQALIPDLIPQVIASDNCTLPASLVISQSPTAGTLVGIGDTVVTLTVTDAALNDTTCVATITVADQTGPVISQCASAQTVAADENRLAAIPNLTPQVIAIDACSPPVTVTQSPSAGAIVGLGAHPVTLTATDAVGNFSTCVAIVTVADQTDPIISQCAPSPTIAADAACQATIPDLTAQVIATDICSPPVIVNQSPTAGTVVGLGQHTVTFTATDAANNSSTCDAVVTVEDQTIPNITQCAAPQTLLADANCQAAIPDLTPQIVANDNCTPALSLVVTQSPAAGTLVGLGLQNVTISVKDAADNEATCVVAITVEDQTDPNITVCAAPQTIAADANCQAAIPDLTLQIIASDNCTPTPSLSITQSPTAGTLVGLGLTNVTLTVEDAAGNDSTCVAAITVADQADPQITTCPGAQSAVASASCDAAVPDFTAGVVANDNCTLPANLIVTQSPIVGTVVGVGPTNVTLTVMDAAGNDTTCVAVFTVLDQTDPQITTCPGGQSAVANASCQATVPDFTAGVVANDNCTLPANLIVTQSPTAGTLVTVGPNNVTLTVADESGNDTTCVAVFTVLDETDPQIITCASNVTIAAGPTCQANIPDLTAGVVANDNCTPALSLVITQSPVAGTAVGLGSTVVTITVQDAASNSDTCDVTVTVEDQTPPELTPCPANIVTNTNAGSCSAVVSWAEPTATDNCGTPTVTRTQGPAPGSTFAANSTTTIEYTATDAANNTITCSFTVTVTPSPDMDNDGDVDPDDILFFVNVLLGIDTTPLRVARADVNCDGSPNGRDVQPFVDILTP